VHNWKRYYPDNAVDVYNVSTDPYQQCYLKGKINLAKNIILFGAGASYGSDNIGTPPLVNNLFNELTKFNPQGWGRLSNNYSFDFQNDFEQGMIKIANERPQ